MRRAQPALDTYAEIPYESTPLPQTHPGHLAVVGRLFGLAAPDPDACRVLELGCAAGGNLIPLAWYGPGCELVGVERSAPQAEAGGALIERLGLPNARILCADLADLDPGLGSFDYVIAHGIYSWVPAPVRERILEICAAHLAPAGVAYVSYNTLPGWRMRGMLRDILLHRVRGLDLPAARLDAARALLAALDPALAGQDALSARYLREEIAHLAAAHPSYLYHEYLEAVNEPCLFRDFMQRAAAHGLQYLGESDLHTMFASTLGDAALGLVEGLDDLLEQEQYIDFLCNRNFRQTLLCHRDRDLVREVDLDALLGLAAHAVLAPPARPDLRRAKPQAFLAPDGQAVQVAHPLTKAALVQLHDAAPDALAVSDVAGAAADRVRAAGGGALAGQRDELLAELFGLFAHQRLRLHPRPRRLGRGDVAERPRAHGLARAQAALGHLATPWHGTVRLDPFSSRLLGYLDGTRTVAEAAERLAGDMLERGDLALPEGLAGRAGADRHRLREAVRGNCRRLVDVFTRHGVLESAALA